MAKSTCRMPGCGDWVYVRDLCNSHYLRQRRHGDPLGGGPFRARKRRLPDFWDLVDKRGPIVQLRPDLGPCWVWQGTVADGYGIYSTQANGERRAYRWAWADAGRDVPDGKVLDHLCHTFDFTCLTVASCQHRRCVNPDHLEAVTQAENVRRGNQGRWSRCANGHPYVTGTTQDGKPFRKCYICNEASRRLRRAECVGDRTVAARPVKHGPELWSLVADLYTNADRHPRLAVAKHFGQSPSTVQFWIARARKEGYLPPTTRGQKAA